MKNQNIADRQNRYVLYYHVIASEHKGLDNMDVAYFRTQGV
jgi:hypothetical protein